jgi:hypothetical protein
MKKNYYYIKPTQTHHPWIFPFKTFIVIWLLLDRLNAPHWLWYGYWVLAGVMGVFMVLSWILIRPRSVDLNQFLEDRCKENEQKEKL